MKRETDQSTPRVTEDVLMKYDPDVAEHSLRRSRLNPHLWEDTSINAFGIMDEMEYRDLSEKMKKEGKIK